LVEDADMRHWRELGVGEQTSALGAKKKRNHAMRIWQDVKFIECKGALEWDRARRFYWCRKCGYRILARYKAEILQ
jgi:hypothetical protein